jgi:hypothetical protein
MRCEREQNEVERATVEVNLIAKSRLQFCDSEMSLRGNMRIERSLLLGIETPSIKTLEVRRRQESALKLRQF